METKIVKKDLRSCAEAIKNGGIVAFPTETVYGLGGNAFSPLAIEKIFAAKGRPADNPLIVHCDSVDGAKRLTKDWNAEVEKLAKTFWPGPLTLLLPKKDCVPDAVTAGLPTVGIRIPDHPLALELIRLSGVPIAAPSANTSTRPSPTRAEHVYADLKGKIPYIIDGGDTVCGLESTVLDCESWTILRPGNVTKEQLEKALGREVLVDVGVLHKTQRKHTPSPGMKYKHYAPGYEVVLVEGSVEFVKSLYNHYTNEGKRVMILAENYEEYENALPLGASPQEISAKLYGLLLSLEGKTDVALIPVIPAEGIGLAVMNRLLRAAGFGVKTEEKDV